MVRGGSLMQRGSFSSFRRRPESRLQRCRRPRRWAPRVVRFASFMALVGGLLASSALLAPTVLAHHFTGEVQLWASTVDFQDSPGGVLVTVRLIERESGESVSGFGARVTATGGGDRVGPVELQESEFAVYSATLPLGPGRWEILVTTHQGASSLPAIESSHRKTLEIDAAGRVVASAGGGSAATTILATVLPICAAVVALLVVLRRRRLALDDEVEAEDVPASDDAGAPTTGGDPAGDRDSR